MNAFKQHLIYRGGTFCVDRKSCWICFEEEVVTFPLWTTCGNLVGYQQYNWKSDKLKNNDSKGRYWTYRRKDVLTAWGLEFTNLSSSKPLYVVEGIWDAISVMRTGRDCIAVLSNNPQQLKHWFNCIPRDIIAVCEGDKAGRMLAKCCDKAIYLPEGKDANDLSVEELDLLLK